MVIRKSVRVAWRTIAGEGVVLSLDTRMLRGLNPVGTRVWELIDGHRAVEAIAAEIAREFAVEPERARADVDAFVAELVDKQLVEVVHAP